MLKMFRDGKDVHGESASIILKKPIEKVTKEERKRSKARTFGYLYGMYAKKFVLYALEKFGVAITLEEAQSDRNGFFNTFTRLLDWHDEVRRKVASAGYVKSPLGRRRRLPHIYSMDRDLKNQAERQAINSPSQATASDFILLIMYEVEKRLPASMFRLTGQMHDSFSFEYNPKYETKVCRTIKEVAQVWLTQHVRKTFGAKVPVPIVIDIEIGTHWSEGKQWVEAT